MLVGIAPLLLSSLLPETDWFSAAGRGVFTHYLSGLQNGGGRNAQGKNSTYMRWRRRHLGLILLHCP